MLTNNKNFLSLLFVWYFSHIARASTVEQQIIGVIDELCTGVNVCKRNETPAISTIPTGLKACCTECSCSTSCSLSGNCCFQTAENKEYHRDQTCISTWNPKPIPRAQFLFSSYFMYTAPPVNGCLTDAVNRVVKKQPTLWRNLLPVYSENTAKIYVNRHVAECHGEFNSTQWRVVASCKREDGTTGNLFDMDANDDSTLMSTNESHCRLNFQFQGDSQNIESERCFPQLISSCGNESFPVPFGINMSQDDVRHACRSGFFSPYTKKANFANVFCYICNRKPFNKNGLCKDFDDRRTEAGNAFDILLNADVLRDMQRTQQKKGEESRKLACPNTMSLPKECRIVLCPKGRTRAQNGTCVWLFQALTNTLFGLFLKLTPKTPLPIDKIHPDGLLDFPSWLTSPWPDRWLPFAVHYESTDDTNSQIKHIWMDQRIEWTGKRIETLIERIEKTLKRQWKALIGNRTIVLDQIIDKNWYFHTNYIKFAGSDRKVMNDNIYPLYRSLALYPLTLYITNPFFCDLVELFEDEFKTTHINEAITYVRTNRTLNAAEYALRQSDRGQYMVMICFEDSDLVLHVSSCPGRKHHSKRIVIAFIVTWLLILSCLS